MSAVLEVRGLEKAFGGIRAVNGVSFEVREGEILGLIGPNGSGKSTLFNCILGQLAPSAGQVRIDGRDITGMRPCQLNRLGVGRTFQLLQVFPQLTVRENLILAGQEHRGSMWSRLVGRRDAGLGAAAERLVVRHQHDGRPARRVRPREQLQELEPVSGVEPRRRLVEQPDTGVLRDRAREKNAASLAAGEGARVPVCETDDVARAHRFERALPVAFRVGGKAAGVRGPTLQHEVEAPDREDEIEVLREIGDVARALPAADRVERDAVEEELAAVGGHDSRGDLQERGFAGAVLAEQGHELSLADRRVEAVERPGRAVSRAQSPRLERRAHELLRRSQANTGAPMAAVTAPTGSSAGANADRETASAATSSAAPPIAETGSRVR